MRHPSIRRRLSLGAAAAAVAAAGAIVTAGPAGGASVRPPTADIKADPGTRLGSPPARRRQGCPAGGGAKPTIVLVHGAWADTSSWRGEVMSLRAAGYDARAIANPLQDLTSDSRYVADYLKTLRGPVVVVGHSYGGAVITNAAAGLPGVKALVYVDASAPAPGESNGRLSGANSVLSRKTPSQLFFTTTYPGASRGAPELYLREKIFVENFAGDLPRGESRVLWASQRGASMMAFTTPSKAAAWKAVPSWYFISTGDQIITAAAELGMARRAHAHITMFHGGSHLTLISHPDAVTAVITKAVCSVH
jgi:pimeloyl-ACP methyl ester carboxylesterase